MAHLWAKWLRHPCRLGDPHRFRAGGGGIQKWPTCGQTGYVTPAVSGIPITSEHGAKSEVAHLWAKWLHHPCRLEDPHRFTAGGGKSQVAHLWAKWLRHPCCLGDPHSFRAGGGGEQKWSTSGQSGYITPAISGIPTASDQGGGGDSEVVHKWAKWLRHPYRLGDPHRFRAGGKIRTGPLAGKVATSPLPSGGSPPLQSRGGGDSKVAHLWANWLRHPYRLGDPHRFRAGGRGFRSGPLVGKVATSPWGGGGQKWPTSGQTSYVGLAVSGIPNA